MCMNRTLGLSPKLIADLIVSVVGFVLATYAVGLDPVVAAALAKALGSGAAFRAGPGHVGRIDTEIPPDEGDAGSAEAIAS